MDQIRLHGFLAESTVNGPGNRSVVWSQGCLRGCEGCFNTESWDINAGDEYTVQQILEMIPFDRIEGVTFSGGEPFLQAAGFKELAAEIRGTNKTVLVYTGFRIEELEKSGDINILALLRNTDLLINGPFMKDIPSVHPWAGSGNQRVLKIEKGRVAGEMFAADGPVPLDMEIHILDDGTVLTTGFK